jgi:hypothetical protein
MSAQIFTVMSHLHSVPRAAGYTPSYGCLHALRSRSSRFRDGFRPCATSIERMWRIDHVGAS